MDTLLAALCTASITALLAWFVAARLLRVERTAVATERERAIKAEAALAANQAAHAEKLALLQDAEQRQRDAFARLSGEALKASSEQFLALAQERMERQQQAARSDLTGLVEPLRVTLDRQEHQVRALEEARQTAYGGIDALLNEMRQGQSALQSETIRTISSPELLSECVPTTGAAD